MKIDIHIAKGSELVNIGYIEAEGFNAEKCFDICNWEHSLKVKPKNLYSNIRTCNHGICFTNPKTNEMWLALSVGWLKGDEAVIKNYINENKDEVLWL